MANVQIRLPRKLRDLVQQAKDNTGSTLAQITEQSVRFCCPSAAFPPVNRGKQEKRIQVEVDDFIDRCVYQVCLDLKANDAPAKASSRNGVYVESLARYMFHMADDFGLDEPLVRDVTKYRKGQPVSVQSGPGPDVWGPIWRDFLSLDREAAIELVGEVMARGVEVGEVSPEDLRNAAEHWLHEVVDGDVARPVLEALNSARERCRGKPPRTVAHFIRKAMNDFQGMEPLDAMVCYWLRELSAAPIDDPDQQPA